jgi:phosphoadenosine phosphosulfate reductase
MSAIEYDEARKMFKYHPLFDWSFEDVENYIRENGIPYNALHDKGYPSIGCEPCTRAIAKGEDFRAGRWWWEQEGHKECGVHFKA